MEQQVASMEKVALLDDEERQTTEIAFAARDGRKVMPSFDIFAWGDVV